MEKRLVLVDASNLVFRCHYATQKFNPATKRREPLQYNGHITGGTFGCLQTLLTICSRYEDAHIICAFDSSSQQRHDLVEASIKAGIFAEGDRYKAGRDRTSSNYQQVIEQLDELREAILPLTKVQVVKVDGAEADDIIGSYTEKHTPCIVVSGDHDFYALLKEGVTLYDTGKNLEATQESVLEEMGFPPSLLLDMGAICGDKSDNIPGVPGVGDKTAQSLVKKYGDIYAIKAGLEVKEERSRYENLFLENWSKVVVSRQLKEIKRDVKIPELEEKKGDLESLTRYCQDVLGAKSILSRLETLV